MPTPERWFRPAQGHNSAIFPTGEATEDLTIPPQDLGFTEHAKRAKTCEGFEISSLARFFEKIKK